MKNRISPAVLRGSALALAAMLALTACGNGAEEREIGADGLDTPSIDYGQSKDFMTHRVLFERDIPGFENVANLDGLPPTGATVVALPMKIEGGSGGPLRIVAFVPNG